jgi:hypothetical protein
MALKGYSRPLDMLLASVAFHQQGKTNAAAKLFVKACGEKGMKEVLADLDKDNASFKKEDKWVSMAKAIVANSSKQKVEVKAEDDDLGLEEINLEEGEDLGGDDPDIDSLLDGLDDEGEMASDDDDEDDKKDDEEKSGEHNDVSKDPRQAEHLIQDAPPKADKNEPAAAPATAKAIDDKRAAAIAYNLKTLARLLK